MLNPLLAAWPNTIIISCEMILQVPTGKDAPCWGNHTPDSMAEHRYINENEADNSAGIVVATKNVHATPHYLLI